MTVGELKKDLKSIPDWIPVVARDGKCYISKIVGAHPTYDGESEIPSMCIIDLDKETIFGASQA